MAISLHSGLVEGRSPFKNSASLTLPELEKSFLAGAVLPPRTKL